MGTPSVSIAQGLGPQAGKLFAHSIGVALRARGLNTDINLPCFDATAVINVLCDARQLSRILLTGLTTASDRMSDVVLIPCNSIHVATPHLKKSLAGRFMPIDQAVMTHIRQTGLKGRFLILGTMATFQSGIYQKGLNSIGCKTVGLPLQEQEKFDQFIFHELVSGGMKESHLHRLRLLEAKYRRQLSADYVILACTELCYLVQMFSEVLPWEIDSMQALLFSAVERLHQLSPSNASHAY